MGFLSGRKQEDDDALPGSDLHIDTEVKVCPSCRRETLPWQTTCPECGVATVRSDQLPASELPHLALDHLDDGLDDGPDDGPDDDLEEEDDPDGSGEHPTG